ncbi:GNAT family N-acetyltransferase [Treponema sp.]|uniref:GNAT family N-acetyltransferase n=1 Tax=Treponema sp. TaxID=166 RepID=UPI003EFDA4A9
MAIVRKVCISDLKNIMEIEKNSFKNGIQESESVFAERIQIFPDGFFILEEENSAAGYFCSELWDSAVLENSDSFSLNHSASGFHRKNGEILYISSVAVWEKYRGRGFGNKLFQDSVSSILEKFPQIKEMVLIVNEEWISAVKIYRKFGFSEYSRIKNFFSAEGKKSDGILMRKTVV